MRPFDCKRYIHQWWVLRQTVICSGQPWYITVFNRNSMLRNTVICNDKWAQCTDTNAVFCIQKDIISTLTVLLSDDIRCSVATVEIDFNATYRSDYILTICTPMMECWFCCYYLLLCKKWWTTMISTYWIVDHRM